MSRGLASLARHLELTFCHARLVIGEGAIMFVPQLGHSKRSPLFESLEGLQRRFMLSVTSEPQLDQPRHQAWLGFP